MLVHAPATLRPPRPLTVPTHKQATPRRLPCVALLRRRRRAEQPAAHPDPHKLLNVDQDPMHADPGSFGKVAEGVLDWEMKEVPPRHKVVPFRQPAPAPAASAQPAQPAAEEHHEAQYYHDPHHLSNVDVNPMSTDPGDLGRVAEGILEEYEDVHPKSEGQ